MDPTQVRCRPRRARLIAAVVAAVFVPLAGGRAEAGVTYALTEQNQLLRFDSATPGTVDQTVSVSGLAPAEDLVGIDFRPAAPGSLFGLGSLGQMYRVDAATGAATRVGSPLDPAAAPLAGSRFGFDFNPAVDRIRVVSDLGENLRLNPNDGSLVAADGNLAYKAGDPNAGQPAGVAAVAYTNSFGPTPAASTTLFGIDSDLGALITIDPPNAGGLNTIGSLGMSDLPLFGGFDIGAGNEAVAATSFEPAFGSLPALEASLYSIDLATGAATEIGTIGDGSAVITGLAFANGNVGGGGNGQPPVVPLPPAVLAAPLVLAAAGLYQRRLKRQSQE